MRATPWIVGLLAFALSGCAGAGGGPRVGSAGPAFELTDIDDQTVGTEASAGEVLLIDFMGANCSTCRLAMRSYVPLHEAYEGQDVRFLSVDVGSLYPALGGENEDEVRRFRDDFDANWSFAMDTKQVATDYEVIALPTTYLLDRQGVIAFKHSGIPSYGCLDIALNHTLEKDYDGVDLRC